MRTREVVAGKILIAGLILTLIGAYFAGRFDVASYLAWPDKPQVAQRPDLQMAFIQQACKCGKGQLKPAEIRLVDGQAQGNDAINIYRVDTSDDKGPITIWLVEENGKMLGGLYAQDAQSSF